jgi:hypothetical protein
MIPFELNKKNGLIGSFSLQFDFLKAEKAFFALWSFEKTVRRCSLANAVFGLERF